MSRPPVRFTATFVALALPVSAAGQDAVVDPDSPSGVEYAIPVEKAREKASKGGGKKRKRPGERSAPLFGEGIEPARSGANAPVARHSGGPGSTQRSEPTPRRDARKRAHPGAGPATGDRAGGTVVPASARTGDEGVSGSVLSAALAALALFSGIAAGALLRRRRRAP